MSTVQLELQIPSAPAPDTAPPTPPRIAGLRYIEDFLSSDEQDSAIDAIDAAPWRDDLRRRVQHYGWRYDYRSRIVTPDMRLGAFPPWLFHLAGKLHHAGHFDQFPDQAIVNEYQPGQGIAMHMDRQCFGPVVATISLADDWRMDFRPLRQPEASTEHLLLRAGSVLALSDDARYRWLHGIAPSPSRTRRPRRLAPPPATGIRHLQDRAPRRDDACPTSRLVGFLRRYSWRRDFPQLTASSCTHPPSAFKAAAVRWGNAHRASTHRGVVDGARGRSREAASSRCRCSWVLRAGLRFRLAGAGTVLAPPPRRYPRAQADAVAVLTRPARPFGRHRLCSGCPSASNGEILPHRPCGVPASPSQNLRLRCLSAGRGLRARVAAGRCAASRRFVRGSAPWRHGPRLGRRLSAAYANALDARAYGILPIIAPNPWREHAR